MNSYSFGKPSGRKIGAIGKYMMYPRTLTEIKDVSKEKEREKMDTEFNFAYGPSAGGLIEPIQFNIMTTGESMRSLSSDPAFKMRYLKVLGRNVEDALLQIERINGPFSASHSIAFLSAVENALNIEVSKDVLMSRIIALELERIRNHFHVVGRMCEAAAFGVPLNSIFYLRELMNRMIGSYTGHRFFYGINKVGQIDANFVGIGRSLKPIKAEAESLCDSLFESKIFVDRLQGNGIVKSQDCVGPVARGSGLEYDARLDSDTLPYKELGFFPLVEKEEGDAMGRFIIRFEEIIHSIEFIGIAEQMLRRSKVIKHKPHKSNGEGVGRVESPSGDIAYLLKVERNRIRKIDMLTSSSINLPVFQASARNTVFTDFHFNWESFGIWISEIAVDFV